MVSPRLTEYIVDGFIRNYIFIQYTAAVLTTVHILSILVLPYRKLMMDSIDKRSQVQRRKQKKIWEGGKFFAPPPLGNPRGGQNFDCM